jgi:hypothetical protein
MALNMLPAATPPSVKKSLIRFARAHDLAGGGLITSRSARGDLRVTVGATASHWPGPAFATGVDVVAGARVDDPDRVRERVAAGDCGTDLHDTGVAKVLHDTGVAKVYVARGADLQWRT